MKFRGADNQEMRNYYLGQFEKFGISRDRIGFCGWKASSDHLQLYNSVDIALDTYPYTGCLTSLEAMWMGVPVISRVGDNSAVFLSRVGLSMLTRLGLEFFTASTPQEYVAKTTALAQNTEALAKIRATMRQRMAASTLCDAKLYAGSVEAAYRKMWYRWCRSQGADVLCDAIDVQAEPSL
jgi:protein O-GlcNAc transferase